MFGGFDTSSPFDDLYRFRRQMNDVFSEFDRHFGLMHHDIFSEDPFFNSSQMLLGGPGAVSGSTPTQQQQQQQQQKLLSSPGLGKDSKSEAKSGGITEQKSDSTSLEPSSSSSNQGALTSNQTQTQMRPFQGWLTRSQLPKCDVIENNDNYQVVCELPGMSKEDVKISLEDDGLMTISAERSGGSEQKDPAAKYHRVERHYGKFERKIPLPKNVQLDKVNAKHEYGLLKINLPKKQKAPKEEAKNIQIQ